MDVLVVLVYGVEYSKEIWLHHTFVSSFSWRKAPADGEPVP